MFKTKFSDIINSKNVLTDAKQFVVTKEEARSSTSIDLGLGVTVERVDESEPLIDTQNRLRRVFNEILSSYTLTLSRSFSSINVRN